MLPQISENRLKWQKSTRRLSYVNVKLPKITTKKVVEDEIMEVKPTITPTLCIDNRYFENFSDISPSLGVEDHSSVEYLTKSFSVFAKKHGELNEKRRNYFEKRGLENAIQLNINQQNDKIGQAIECLAVCEEITQKYNCSLNNSFQILIDEFASKTFKLASITTQLQYLRQNQKTDLISKSSEKSRISDLEWRIEREKTRISELDEKLKLQ